MGTRALLALLLAAALPLAASTAGTAREALASIRALPHPDDDANLAGYLRTSQAETDLLAAQASALRHGDLRGVAGLNARLARLGPRVRVLAKRFGFHV